jgi:lauroyl/myristoyl acyltransferase
VAVLEEASRLALSPAASARREERIVANARWLGLEIPPARARSFVRRHDRLQNWRQAEEMLCLFGDIEAQVRWAEETFVLRGLDHARRAAAAGGGAVVVGAHLGPMVYYIPMLAYYLSKTGPVPEMLAVMNAPAREEEVEMIRAQFERFAGYHASPLGALLKDPGGEGKLLRELDRALSRKAWVMMQIDVVTGGSTLEPLDFAGRRLRLPGVWGAVRLARRRGVPLLPAITWRTRRDGLAMRVEPPVEIGARPPAGSPGGDAIAGAARALTALLEKWVRRDPADWGQLANLHLLAAESG